MRDIAATVGDMVIQLKSVGTGSEMKQMGYSGRDSCSIKCKGIYQDRYRDSNSNSCSRNKLYLHRSMWDSKMEPMWLEKWMDWPMNQKE